MLLPSSTQVRRAGAADVEGGWLRLDLLPGLVPRAGLHEGHPLRHPRHAARGQFTALPLPPPLLHASNPLNYDGTGTKKRQGSAFPPASAPLRLHIATRAHFQSTATPFVQSTDRQAVRAPNLTPSLPRSRLAPHRRARTRATPPRARTSRCSRRALWPSRPR